MENPTVKIFVNLWACKVTVQIIQRYEIFRKADRDGVKRFVIEADSGGFSCIEVRNGHLYYVNYLYHREKGKIPIEEKPLTEAEAKDLIREHYERVVERMLWGE
mgnify:CR=1 FL=1